MEEMGVQQLERFENLEGQVTAIWGAISQLQKTMWVPMAPIPVSPSFGGLVFGAPQAQIHKEVHTEAQVQGEFSAGQVQASFACVSPSESQAVAQQLLEQAAAPSAKHEPEPEAEATSPELTLSGEDPKEEHNHTKDCKDGNE